ncbi:TetR/AcrR family transcriptional regulator [Paraburkholderia elongata]|uniref:TetR family transcriptional regulator n=1 Tax=Paraburkholderia elongata TaxID=2675747 RepID=A0A972SF22_9BURK|nr:TetR/AcrR family transcriptional regulator [Paraburkholderia elongata]NPT53398.1 TetR family transcriptional regulator [Paraburkholderia elongata]
MPKTLSSDDIQQFRETMRRVAENAFATRGAQGVTMRELAKELGCSAMTPYRYFRDKDEILAMVRAAAFNRFAARLEAAAREAPATDHSAVSDAYVAFALDEPHAYRLMFDLTQPEGAYPELTAASQRAWKMLGAHFEQLVAAGIMEGDPQLIGYAYWASLHGFTMLALANQLPLPQAQQVAGSNAPTREAVFAQIRRMLWRGAQPQRG